MTVVPSNHISNDALHNVKDPSTHKYQEVKSTVKITPDGGVGSEKKLANQ